MPPTKVEINEDNYKNQGSELCIKSWYHTWLRSQGKTSANDIDMITIHAPNEEEKFKWSFNGKKIETQI
jgi:hypothetical protein